LKNTQVLALKLRTGYALFALQLLLDRLWLAMNAAAIFFYLSKFEGCMTIIGINKKQMQPTLSIAPILHD
jgi:hypothetical protein